MNLPQVSFLGTCYYKSDGICPIIPNVVPDDTFYIEVLTSGNIIFPVNGVRRQLGRGTIFWHEGGEKSIWELGDAGRYSAFVLRGSYHGDSPRRPARVSSWLDPQELDHFASVAMRDAFDDDIDKDILAPYLFMRFYYEAYRGLDVPHEAGWPVALERALSLLQSADLKAISVTQLANYAQISESHLFLLFRTHLNTSPHQYLLDYRLKRAKILLAASNHPIKEIALDCGFTSVESFYRAFRARVRQSPAIYRRSHTAMTRSDLIQNRIDTLE